MRSQSTRLTVSMIGKTMVLPKENGHPSEKDLRMHVRRKMLLLTRSIMW